MDRLEQPRDKRYPDVPFTLAFSSSSPLVVASHEQLTPFEVREQRFFADIKAVVAASTHSPDGTARSTAVASDSHSGGRADDTTTDHESDAVVDQKTDD